MAFSRTILFFAAACCPCCAQTQATPQNSSAKTQPAVTTQAPLPPSSPDAPIFDQGAIPARDNSGSRVKRVLRRLDPNCLDAIFHLCWSSPLADGPVYTSYEKRRIAEDLEVGSSYLKEKNYRGAEFRFEDVLNYEPDNSEAMFKLAESVAKLGNKIDALDLYKAYLETAPDGPFAARARKALQTLEH